MNTLSITRSNGVATVVLDNPPANILTIEVINEVNAFVKELAKDNDTKAVVFKSDNKQFFRRI